MADWRGKQRRRHPVPVPKAATGATPSPKTSTWHGKSKKGGGQRGDGGLFLKRVMASVSVVLILFVLITMLFWNRVPTPLAILSVQSYPNDSNGVIPPRTLKSGVERPQAKYLRPTSKSEQREKGLMRQLDDIIQNSLKPGGPDKNVVLVSIAAQGVVNGKGEPCLLDMSSEPFVDDGVSWIPLKQIFEKLFKKISASDKTHVVVFLDSGVAGTDWPMGWLRDDFKSQLAKALEVWPTEVWPKKWHLLHVRGTAEMSAFARTGRRVLFADLLSSGLRGAANGATGNQRDQKVSLSELISFVEKETGVPPDIWPVLESGGKNLNLCWSEAAALRNKLSQLTIDQVPEKLARLWEMHHRLEEKLPLPWRSRPWDWARFEWLLLRAERAWLANDIGKQSLAVTEAAKLAALLDSNQTISPLSLSPDEEPWKAIFDELENTTSLEKIAIPPGNSSAAALALMLKRDVCDEAYSKATGAAHAKNNIRNLILTRRQADSGALPKDFRAESIIRFQAGQVDETRRSLEDLAFAGGEENWTRVGEIIKKVNDEYANTSKKSNEFADRLNERDQLFAKLAWLFRWAEASNANEETCQQLVKIWNNASDAMRRFETEGTAPSDWSEWRDACEQSQKLHKDLVESATKLLNKTASDSAHDWVGKALPFLATPLVSGRERIDLLKGIVEKTNKPYSSDTKLKNDRAPSGSIFSSWPSHPLNLMFQTSSNVSNKDDANPRLEKYLLVDQTSSDQDWWQAGRDVRQKLKPGASPYVSELLEKQPQGPEQLTEYYRSLVRYDGQIRAVAMAQCAGDVSQSQSPEKVIERLDHLQMASYCDWRVRRAILDFYGPTEQRPDLGEPFYKRQAEYWFGKFGQPGSELLEFSQAMKGYQSVLSWKDKGKEPLPSLLSVSVDPSPLEFADGRPVQQTAKVTVSAVTEGDLRPSGVVAVELPKQLDPPLSASPTERRRIVVPYPADAGNNYSLWGKKEISIPIGPIGESTVPILAFFRGHASLDAVIRRNHKRTLPPVNREVPTSKPGPADATVIVKGRSPQKLWLMVVLDCSLSMQDNMPPNENVVLRRFDVAKSVLKNMLQRLLAEAQESQCELHIGLIAYGYRVGIETYPDKQRTFKKLIYANPNNGSRR